jgi:bifunctional DNase/RNase
VISLEQNRVSGPRPMTHQLIGDVLSASGRRLEQVRITDLRHLDASAWEGTLTLVAELVLVLEDRDGAAGHALG